MFEVKLNMAEKDRAETEYFLENEEEEDEQVNDIECNISSSNGSDDDDDNENEDGHGSRKSPTSTFSSQQWPRSYRYNIFIFF